MHTVELLLGGFYANEGDANRPDSIFFGFFSISLFSHVVVVLNLYFFGSRDTCAC